MRAAALLATLSAPAALMAADGGLLPASSGPGMGELFLRLLGALLIVFAALFTAVRFLKGSRWARLSGADRAQLRVVESKGLGARQSISVIAYNEKRFLVSTGPQGAALLTQLPDAPREETQAAPSPAPPFAFGDLLMRAIQQRST